MSARHAVYLEVAPKRAFAAAVDWPGWTRAGRTETDALEALLAAAPRYAMVAAADFSPPDDVSALTVTERLRGGASTEFGVPGEVPTADARPLDAAELARYLRLLNSAWGALDAAARAAEGVVLRTGPRGGGRDVPKMLAHVLDAERSYLAKLGARYGGPSDHAELRKSVVRALTAVARGEPIPDASAVRKRWPPRYFVRRAAWHVLDHTWEIEDRAA